MKSISRDISFGLQADVSPHDWYDWKWQYNNRIKTIPQLAGVLGKTPASLREYTTVVRTYPVNITPFYLSLINIVDEKDPMRLQCFPDLREIEFSIDGVDDPLAEGRDMPVPGLVHRYPDRCVTIITNICATYCRHCNRKRLWKRSATGDYRGYLKQMIDYVSQTSSIREVIVSGGDPLTVGEDILDWFLGSLRSISHVDVLRIGSRVPVVMPMRVNRGLCSMLRKHRPLWLNTQFNHPKEITREAAGACEMLLEAGIPVSSQSVLLRGVNDNYEAMRDLFYGLQRISVRPYYLFQCDPVKGADHFRTDIRQGVQIMEKLWRNISGLCLPQYVLDVPGGKGKYPLYPFRDSLMKDLETGEHFFDRKQKVD